MPSRWLHWGGISRRRLAPVAAYFLGALLALQFISLGTLRAQSGDAPSDPDPVLTDQQQDWLRDHPQIRVGIDPAWPPFSYYSSENQLVGMDLDMLNALHKRLGITFVTVSGSSWSEVYT